MCYPRFPVVFFIKGTSLGGSVLSLTLLIIFFEMPIPQMMCGYGVNYNFQYTIWCDEESLRKKVNQHNLC